MTGKRRQDAGQPRRLLCFSAAFCAVCLVFALAYSGGWPRPLLWPLAAAVLCGAMLCFGLRKRALVWIAGLACGLAWTLGFWYISLRPAEAWREQGAELTVELTSRAAGYATYGTAEGNLVALNGRPASGRAFVYLIDGSPDLVPGTRITFVGIVRASERLDEGLVWSARQTGPLETDSASPPSWRARFAQCSDVVGQRIDELVPGDEGALLKALICGDTGDMSRALRSALSISGLSHIAAVSGMHLSMLVGFACALLGKRWGSAAAVPLIVLYTAFTGMSPSIVRAAVMSLMASAAFFLRREHDSLTSLFAALLVLAAANPFSLLSPSLLLSFSATLGILLFAPALMAAFPKPPRNRLLKKPIGYVLSSTAVSLAATACVTPVTMLFFSRVSVLSVLSGLLVLWAVTLAMALGIAALVLSAVWMPAAVFLAQWLVRPVMCYITGMTRLFGGNPALTAASDSPYLLVALIAVIVLLAALRQKRPLRGLLPLTGALLALCIVFSGAERLLLTRVSIVGADGSAIILIDSRGKSCAVNCGLGAAGRNARAVGEYLYRWGRGGVDTLLVTSPAARAGGGLDVFCDEIDVGHSLAPAGSRAARSADSVYSGGGSLQWGSARIELIPLGGTSCAVRVLLPHLAILDLTQAAAVDYVTYADGALLTGDIAVATESFLSDSPAAERLLRAAGCRAVLCADSGYLPVQDCEQNGVGVYSLSAHESIELTTLNW